MSRLNLRGPRKELRRSEVQFQIWQQLTTQKGYHRSFEVGRVRGDVLLDSTDSPSKVIDLIKARAEPEPLKHQCKGEIALVSELAKGMSVVHDKRLRSLLDELDAILEEAPLIKSYRPPASVAREAARGLELRREHKRGGLSAKEASEHGIGSGVQRAVNLKNRDSLSLDTVKRMKSFFNRHRTYKERGYHRDRTSASYISWLLWGGDAGDKWAQRTVKESEK